MMISREQEIHSFMNHSFFPPWKEFPTSEFLSEHVSRFFMCHPDAPYVPDVYEISSPIAVEKISIPSPIRLNTPKATYTSKEIRLDWRYWAFWTAWIAFHGINEYHKIEETERFAFWIKEKTQMSDWFQEHFLVAKKEIAKRWDKMTNLEMEDAITGLVTDINENDSGLKSLLLCWTYYSMTAGGEGGAVECIWVVPGKSLYYSFSHGEVVVDDSDREVKKWGVFMEIMEARANKLNNEAVEKSMDQAPTRKPLKPQKRFVFRALETGELEKIRENMIEIKSVNRALAAISKYTLKDLAEMGDKLGLRPPAMAISNEKEAMKLDLAAKISEAERGLGVVRKLDSSSGILDKKEMEKMEKWKKNDWYEQLECFCMNVF